MDKKTDEIVNRHQPRGGGTVSCFGLVRDKLVVRSEEIKMGKKVYDPIHDVFQDQEESDSKNSSPVKTQNMRTAKEESTSAHERAEGKSDVEDNSESNDSTESEDNANAGGETHDGNVSVVPSVATHKKRMKESSKYNRHLKKPDGEFFSRKDLQFHFLYQLLIDKRLLFTNIFKDVYSKSVVPLQIEKDKIVNVTDSDYDARTFIFNDKLTFSQIYILALASSTKCSKVLRDKLLLDQQVAFSTCILGLLVNIGRLNTTINFYLEMTSQLRTFHSVPVLQYKVTDLKSLQDTPRLKSILKNLPVGNDPVDFSHIYDSSNGTTALQNLNVVNLLFAICDNVSLVNLKLISKYVETRGESISLFSILDFPWYEPKDRCNVLLWLLYIHAETDLSETSIRESIKLFTVEEKIPLEPTDKEYDEDPREEYEFGMKQKAKRKEFLKKIKESKKNGTDSDEASEAEATEPTEPIVPKDVAENKKDGEASRKRAVADETEIEEQAKYQQQEQQEQELQEQHGKEKEHSSELVNSTEEANGENDPVSRSIKNIKTETNNRIDKLIEMDQQKIVGKINNKAKTETDFLKDLAHAQEPANLKRKDLGLIKVFNEYEDIPMASVIGIRGKKRKRFRDSVLGFETDYLKSFAAAKKLLLRPKKSPSSNDETRIFL